MRVHRPSSAERLLDLLRDGTHLTQKEAADRLDLSTRQVRRLLKQLGKQGIDIQEAQRGKQKEYYLDGADLRAENLPLDLTERQVLALVVAAQAAQAKLAPTPLARYLAEAVEALHAIHPDPAGSFETDTEPARWHFSDAPSVPIDPDVFWTLRAAASNHQPVRIDYYSASSERRSTDRKIDPLLIAERRGSWLCVAYCHERRAVLDFSMAAISSVEPCEGEIFDPPLDFERATHFEGRFGAVAGEATHSVRLLVEPKRVPYFRRKMYHPSQHIDEVREDGRVIVSYEVAGLEEVAAWVRSWGSGVKVLDPPELAEQIAADAAAMRARYEG